MKAKKLAVRFALIIAVALLGACASMGGPTISEDTRSDLVERARLSLDDLYGSTPQARDLSARSVGILVFPDIFRAGLIVGGSGGNGVMFSPTGRALGYYNAASVSYGLQVGVQGYAQALFLMKADALKYLESSEGWSIGVGPSVVVVDMGAAKDLTSTTLRADVYAFIYSQEGLMGALGIQGQKITKLAVDRP